MATDGIIGKRPDLVGFAPRCRILESAHADVAGRCAGENRPLQGGFTKHRFTGGHHRKAACRRYVQSVQGLADDILPKHRPQGRPAVPLPRKRSLAGPFVLDVVALPFRCHLLAQQYCPPIAKHGEISELMPRIGLSERLGALGDPVARENGGALVAL